MIVNTVPTNEVQGAAAGQLAVLTDYFDVAPIVRLVEGEFDPQDQTTWPTPSTAFAALTATDPWEEQFDAASGDTLLVAPDPDGGWDFVSTAGGVTITGFICYGGDPDFKVVASKFATPIGVTATGQHITLPYIATKVSAAIQAGPQPYVLP